eukprot:GHVP01051772.1.p2 GENE.GHVP01051772.1~~GHVP01051772.1.p2  ORF type:complete len:207 (+),score=36.55 GHVP01051772.1:18-638(+)
MEDSARRFFRARKTCHEMLSDRGYFTGSERHESFENFKEKFELNENQRSRLLIIGSKEDESGDQNKILIFFSDETKKTGVKPIRELLDKMEEKGIKRAILVTQNVLTAFARDAIAEAAPQQTIEHFNETELLVNITRHELVPEHIPLSIEEKKQLLSRYKIQEHHLPRILQTDPVARYYGATKGAVLKIIRPSETAGRYVTYRLVV